MICEANSPLGCQRVQCKENGDPKGENEITRKEIGDELWSELGLQTDPPQSSAVAITF